MKKVLILHANDPANCNSISFGHRKSGLSNEESVLNASKTTVQQPFNFDCTKKALKATHNDNQIVKLSKKNWKNCANRNYSGKLRTELPGRISPGIMLRARQQSRSATPKAMKSALKTQVVSNDHLKRVKFEDFKEYEDYGKDFEVISRKTFQNFWMSARKSPSYFSPKCRKNSPRFTISDLKKY